MIRRDMPSAHGGTGHCILISQVDHAQLAGELAAHWGREPFSRLVPREELLWAVYHHDDGWHEWERAPDVDQIRGQPRSFMEMEIAESVRIWSASIDSAAAAGSLQAYLVAGHFCALTRRFAIWSADDPRSLVAAQFLHANETRMTVWLDHWRNENPHTHTAEIAEQALAHLQFFDLFSLWFCCTPGSRPAVLTAAFGPNLVLQSIDESRIQVDPWPFVVSKLNLEIPGRAIPLRRYSSPRELAEAPSRPIQLHWQLEMVGPGTETNR